MLSAISLGSSSDGNSLLVLTKKTRILIDAGLTFSKIIDSLKYLNIEPQTIDSILITHEHNDHAKSAFKLSSQFHIPVLATKQTINVLKTKSSNKSVLYKAVITGEKFKINELEIKVIPVYHDAMDPVGFTVKYNEHKISYFVDIARITGEIQNEINTSNLVIIDSNYDTETLLTGKYPYTTKQRIKNYGHLSNEIVANIILSHPNKHNVEFWCAHLSKENNSPEMTAMTINYILKQGRCTEKVIYKILSRDTISQIWSSKEEKQLLIPTVGIPLTDELTQYREQLSLEQLVLFDMNLQKAVEIPLNNVEPVLNDRNNSNLWRVINSDSAESYIIAKNMNITGIDGIKINDTIWTCECGDFIFRCQKLGIPCKHILRILLIT